jgi:hypothetical protein
MPLLIVRHGDACYCWNSKTRKIEIAKIQTEPVEIEAVPKEVIQDLMELLDAGNTKKEGF